MTSKDTPDLSEALHAAEQSLADRQEAAGDTPPSAPHLDTPQTQAVAAALAHTNPPIVYSGHTQSLFGELSAKASTLQVMIEDLVEKQHQVDLDAELAIEAIKAKRSADIAQLEAERANAVIAWTVLSETASKLKT